VAVPSIYLAEEVLSLPPEQRRQLANILLDSLRHYGATDEQTKEMLLARIADLRSGRDPGVSFEDVFGELLH
jgi:putative addiction module component (TIGR02574 family)